MRGTRNHDVLGPLEFLATLLLAANALLLAFSLVFGLLGHSAFGEDHVCVDFANGTSAQLDSPPGVVNVPGASSREVSEGVKVHAARLSVCDPTPTQTERWWNRLALWPRVLYGMGLLTLIWTLTRRARRSGFFVQTVARGLSRLGIYLVLGSITVSTLVLFARKSLLASLLPTADYSAIGLHLSWSTILIGAGVFTLGRVMSQAVAMREELDATI